ncbi:hypothetical protein Tco_0000710 [Tanacetum coccineum]
MKFLSGKIHALRDPTSRCSQDSRLLRLLCIFNILLVGGDDVGDKIICWSLRRVAGARCSSPPRSSSSFSLHHHQMNSSSEIVTFIGQIVRGSSLGPLHPTSGLKLAMIAVIGLCRRGISR